MARVTGPLFSHDARGSLGTSLNFSRNKGAQVARMVPSPPDPKTPPQVSYRALMKFLSPQWGQLSLPAKDTWKQAPTPPYVSPHNAFTGINTSRWNTFRAPTQTYDPPGPPAPPLAPSISTVPGVKKVTLRVIHFMPPFPWGFALFRGIFAGFVPALDNAVALFPRTASWTYYVDKPLKSGVVVCYKVRAFSHAGDWGLNSGPSCTTPL